APSMARAMRERRRREERPAGRRVTVATGRSRFGRSIGVIGVPMPTIDPLVVSRSARALDRYGPDFRYGHFLVARSALPTAASVAGEVGAAVLARLRRSEPVTGPTAAQRAKNWFRVTFVGEVTEGDHKGHRVVTEVSGGDPGYGETATMLGQSALCLAHDDLKPTAGQLTTAVAMGNALIDRLDRAGMPFRVLS
ncbi:MAG: saccharopine dehydrogenase, partial [Acidimicrobiales bacterium]